MKNSIRVEGLAEINEKREYYTYPSLEFSNKFFNLQYFLEGMREELSLVEFSIHKSVSRKNELHFTHFKLNFILLFGYTIELKWPSGTKYPPMSKRIDFKIEKLPAPVIIELLTSLRKFANFTLVTKQALKFL